MMRHTPNPDELKKDYEAEMKRFREVKSKAAATGGETAERLVEEVEASPLAQDVKETLAAAKADPSAALQGEKRLLELKLKLDEAADALEWPALVAESRDWLGHLQKVADQHGNSQQKQKADDLAAEVEEIIRDHKPDRLRKTNRADYPALLRNLMCPARLVGLSVPKDGKAARRNVRPGESWTAAWAGPGLSSRKTMLLACRTSSRQLWDLLPGRNS